MQKQRIYSSFLLLIIYYSLQKQRLCSSFFFFFFYFLRTRALTLTLTTQMASDAASYTPEPFRLRWDVFLSFRGEDTRHTITHSLYDSLHKHGIRVFRDDEGLNRGDEIAPSLFEAIYDSAASIVILSPNYASSRWCLEELGKICELNRLILPVFYQVDPSHVRR